MSAEYTNNDRVISVKGPEIRLVGPRFLDPVLMRVWTMALLAFEAVRAPSLTSQIYRNLQDRTLTVTRIGGNKNG